MSSPAVIIREMLIDLGLVSESGGWPAYVSFLPEGPDSAIGIFDTAGIMDGRLMEDGTQIVHPGIQIQVRGLYYPATRQKIDELAEELDKVNRREVGLSSSEYWLVLDVLRIGDILPLGIQEENGKRRHYFTLNAVLSLEPV